MPTSRRLAVDVLAEWSHGFDFAAALIDDCADHCNLSPRDTALLQNLVLTVLRNRSLLDAWITKLTDGKAVDDRTQEVLRLGVAQLLLLEMPVHAAVNETVECAGRARKLVNAVLRRTDRERTELLALRDTLPLHLQLSHPEWLVQRWTRLFGPDTTRALLEWNQKPAPVYVRPNLLQPDAAETCAAEPGLTLREDGFYACESAPRKLLAQGLCYAQDPSTAAAPRLLNPKPGDHVLDACAAPGGKTAFLAEMMQNGGMIIAADSSSPRVRRMMGNLKRMGVLPAEGVVHDWTSEVQPLWAQRGFDKILVDVPCSNTGVMRRRVDVRWRLQESAISEMAALQTRITLQAARSLRLGGSLVYSTCSIDAEENEQVVEAILSADPTLKRKETRQSLPWADGLDGAFAVRLVKASV
jgi:16S rRNA (cytosine967-C5)-methyltransferase